MHHGVPKVGNPQPTKGWAELTPQSAPYEKLRRYDGFENAMNLKVFGACAVTSFAAGGCFTRRKSLTAR